MKRAGPQVRRHDLLITPDKSRVLLRPFVPGNAERMKGIFRRIVQLREDEAQESLEKVLLEFRDRHRDLEGFLQQRFDQVRSFLPSKEKPSAVKRLLVGSFSACEYSLEAAALFNPSIVPHPDQGGVGPGSLRFIMSLRATGEGHISSIEFRTGVIHEHGQVSVDPPGRFVAAATVSPDPLYNKTEFTSKVRDEECLSAPIKEILRSLPETFKRSELRSRIRRFRVKHPRLQRLQSRSLEYAEALTELNYEIDFPSSVPLSERVVFPASSYESNGIEDARFVRHIDDDGRVTYYATYTAYNGKAIMPLLLETTDFAHFQIRSLSGRASRNKGMALFPRKIGGKYGMISRHDGENLFIALSDNVYSWDKPINLLKPSYPWELTQIGNCGSPLETERGWILLTHGVGPLRKYCIGAAFLDRDNPTKVIGRLREPLILPHESEREGYVPNVVYTCGAIIHNQWLIIPYAMSDTATRIASVAVDELLDGMEY